MNAHPFNEIDRLAHKLKQERDARESQRETLQIKARAIEFPAYDNSDLFSLERWIVRNLDTLKNYFHSLAEATGEPVLESEEIRVMTVIQYERQLELHAREIALQPRVPEWDEQGQRDRRTWQQLMADDVCIPEFGPL